jgi:hypothetical protein
MFLEGLCPKFDADAKPIWLAAKVVEESHAKPQRRKGGKEEWMEKMNSALGKL